MTDTYVSININAPTAWQAREQLRELLYGTPQEPIRVDDPEQRPQTPDELFAPDPQAAEKLAAALDHSNEPPKVDAEREALLAEARELGVKHIRQATTNETIREKIAKARAEQGGQSSNPVLKNQAGDVIGPNDEVPGPAPDGDVTFEDVQSAVRELVAAGAGPTMVGILQELKAFNQHGQPNMHALKPDQYAAAVEKFRAEAARLKAGAGADEVQV